MTTPKKTTLCIKTPALISILLLMANGEGFQKEKKCVGQSNTGTRQEIEVDYLAA